jgi:hypothetical protein
LSREKGFQSCDEAPDTRNGGDEAQLTKTTAKARTTAKATADFSTAAANAPPSVEMTIVVVLESFLDCAFARNSDSCSSRELLRTIRWND